MKILVDAAMMKPTIGGIRTFYREAVREMATRPDVNVVVATSMPEAFFGCGARTIVTPRAARSFLARVVWRDTRFRRTVDAEQPDVVVNLAPEAPFRRLKPPVLATVHDTSHLLAPALYGWRGFVRFLLLLPLMVRRADVVAVVSSETRANLFRFLGIRPERVTVVGNAAQRVPFTPRHPARSPFFLYVGSLWPHKNVPTILESLRLDRSERSRLVLTGPATEPELEAVRAEAERLGVSARVEHLGYVSPELLSELLATTSAVVFPSLIEGFGMPVLEAMAHGTPVISSSLPAVRAWAGGHVTYVDDPLDPREWLIAMKTHMDRGDATRMNELESARRHAARFGWVSVVDQLLEACRDAVRSNPTNTSR